MASSVGPFNKVVALTQGMLNYGFRSLHGDTYDEQLKSLRYPDPDQQWDVSLSFKAPEIVISNAGDVYLRVCVNRGTISTLGEGAVSVIMDDWKLCHKIDTQILLRARTELADYDVSVVEGDVSAERMLAILMAAPSSAGFSVDEGLSDCTDKDEANDGQRVSMSWRIWSAKNPVSAKALSRVLSEWPTKLGKRGYNYMGLRFKLPQVRPDVSVSEKSLDTRRVVVYRSSTPNKDQAVSNDKNAILVCSGGEASAAAGTDFDDSVFVQNYVGEALLTAGSDVFSGFWVTNYRRVLDSLLLPRLRIINAASELKIGQPTWENQMYVPNYEIRRDFKSAAEDKVWAEEWSSHDFSVTDAATQATHSYSWRSEDGPYSLDSTLEKQGKSLRSSLSIAVDHMSAVRYTPGLNIEAIRADFTTTYKSQAKWVDVATGQSPGSYKYDIICTWYLVLTLHVGEGGLYVKVEKTPVSSAIKNFFVKSRVEMVGFKEPWEVKVLSQLKRFFDGPFKESVDAACTMFTTKITDLPQWATPEEKWLQFQKAVLNRQGDLIVGFNYAPPTRQDLFQVADLSIRPPPRPPVPAPPPEPEPVKPSTLRLKWTATAEFSSPKNDRLRVTLRATNESAEPLTAATVKVVFQTSLQGAFLFSALIFSTATDKVNKVLVLEPVTGVSVSVAKDPGGVAGACKATLIVTELRAGPALAVQIEGATKVAPGQKLEHPLWVSEAWTTDEGEWVEGAGQLVVAIP